MSLKLNITITGISEVGSSKSMQCRAAGRFFESFGQRQKRESVFRNAQQSELLRHRVSPSNCKESGDRRKAAEDDFGNIVARVNFHP
jgi:hypothetical protein